MNITTGQYSKAISRFKRPKSGQDLKLIYVFPIIFDKTIDFQYQKLIRDMISILSLKEIIVSNALQIFAKAEDVYEYSDILEKKPTNPMDKIIQIQLNNNQDLHSYNINPLSYEKNELQRKIKEKSNVILKLITTDPHLKALNPHIDIITLKNLIDIPVITGTKQYMIGSQILLMMILMAIANKSVSFDFQKIEDVNKIFNIIKNINPNESYTILNNIMVAKPTIKQRIENFFSKHLNAKLLVANVPYLSKLAIPEPKSEKESETTIKPVFNEASSFSILSSAVDDMFFAKDIFSKVIDPIKLKKETGVDINQSNMSEQFKNITPEIDLIFDKLEFIIMKMLEMYSTDFLDFFVSLSHTDPTLPLDTHKIYTNAFNNFYTKMQKYIMTDSFKTLVVNTFQEGSINDNKKKIDILDGICEKNFMQELTLTLDKINKLINDNVFQGNMNSLDDFSQMVKKFTKISHISNSGLIKVKKFLSIIFGKKMIRIFNDITRLVKIELIDNISGQINDVEFTQPFLKFVGVDKNDNIDINKSKKYIKVAKDEIVDFITFLVLYSIQLTLCDFISTIKLTVKTAKNNITSMPNYTLVLPIEMIYSAHAALAAKNYKQLLDIKQWEKKENASRLITQSGKNPNLIIKDIHDATNIPNLIVIDEKTDTIYYKLMYQTKVNKIKLSSLKTLITQTKNKNLNIFGGNDVYY